MFARIASQNLNELHEKGPNWNYLKNKTLWKVIVSSNIWLGNSPHIGAKLRKTRTFSRGIHLTVHIGRGTLCGRVSNRLPIRHWNGAGNWNHFTWMTRSYWFYLINIIAANGLATQVARTSTAMILPQFSRNNPAPATYGLTRIWRCWNDMQVLIDCYGISWFSFY